MQIDWFTLVAQIVNFLILLFLLQRFLYRPIVRAMEEREKKIASDLQAAEEKRAEARQEAARYRQQQQELKRERESIAARAEEEAAEQRKQLLKQTRAETEEIQKRWREAIEREQDRFLQDLRKRTSEQVVGMVRQALEDLADADLEHQIVGVFIQKLRTLDEQQRRAMTESIEKSGGQIVIRSTFGIPNDARDALVGALAEEVYDGDNLQARFERSPDLICGIEVQGDGRRLAWSIDDYLHSVEEHVMQALQQEIGREADREEARV